MNLLVLGKSCLKSQYLNVDRKKKSSFVETWEKRASSRKNSKYHGAERETISDVRELLLVQQKRGRPLISKSEVGIRSCRVTGHRNDCILPREMGSRVVMIFYTLGKNIKSLKLCKRWTIQGEE